MSDDGLHAILMPKWGLAIHEGTIAEWSVAEGDTVAEGDALCDIETSKITNEFESPTAGTLARIVRPAGDIVGIGEVIAVIARGDADTAAIDALVARRAADAGGAEDETAEGPQSVETDAGTIAYLETGDPAAGRTVLLLHGFGGDHTNWDLLQAELPQDSRIVALDLPGHGASTSEVGDGSATTLARAVIAFADALDLADVDLIAHSFGATVAAAVVSDRPALARSLAVIAPPAFGATANPDYVEGFVAAKRKKDMQPVMEMLFSDPDMVGRTMVNEAVARYRDDRARAALATIGEALVAAGPDTTLAGHDGTVVIWGDRDHVVPLPDDAAHTLGDRLHVIEGAGHMPHAEAPEKVAALLREVLTR